MKRPSIGPPLAQRLLTSLVAAAVVGGIAGCTASGPSAPSSAPSASRSQDSEVFPTEPVPAPGGGDITETVPSVEAGPVVETTLDAPAVLPSDVTVSVAGIRREDVVATTPGEIAGPVVVVTIRIENGTSSELDLGSTTVNLLYGSGDPGLGTTAGPFSPFTEAVAPGASLEGVYVFGVPSGSISPVQISVSYAGGAPVALFAGDVS